PTRRVYESLDEKTVAGLVSELEKAGGDLPDVVTVYLVGMDAYTHVAKEGPDAARRGYLRGTIDPLCRDLAKQPFAIGDVYTLVLSDHGHTPVVYDRPHALSTDDPDDPPAVLKAAGFRVR